MSAPNIPYAGPMEVPASSMEPGASVALTVYDRGEVSTVPRWYFQGLGSEHPVIWDSLIGELGETTDRHVGFDPRGIGASTGFPESFDQVVDDAVRVLDKLEIDEAQIVGQSLGGVFAMSFATRYPDRTHSLVVIDSVPKPDDNLREQADRRLALLSSGRSQEVIKRVAHFAFSEEFRANNPALMEDFAKMLGRQDPEVYAQYCRLGASTSVELDYPGPKLFVAGRDDRLTPPATVRAVAESVGGRFTEIPDASHNPQMEQPKLLADVIRLFTASD